MIIGLFFQLLCMSQIFQNKKLVRKDGVFSLGHASLELTPRQIRPRIKRMSKDEYIGLSPPYFFIHNIPLQQSPKEA